MEQRTSEARCEADEDPFADGLAAVLTAVTHDIEDGNRAHENDRLTGDANNPEAAVRQISQTLFPGRDFRFDETVVKNNLDDILLCLITLREDETHGKRLMDDLVWLFDARLSPGTVYPELHELEAADVLDAHEKVRTKEYNIADNTEARDRLSAAVRQHLGLAFVLSTALADARDP
jgi:hypothetical protein